MGCFDPTLVDLVEGLGQICREEDDVHIGKSNILKAALSRVVQGAVA